ncbi:glycoside hydrolase family 88/105 protein [Ruminococcus flavefaciens]|uniref:Glycosyl hydrolase family 88 n=1 Tax=Ruminococcus flavefaciens 007c TaxID=1341157 RepID=W7UHS4_RUMFL|nr:glycoside hydrolase family 88 protein [Ruminococcus flavefaciens]EWM53538.1 hypothetical protein RF007C_07600 [Ruminococcus flavefaciens 007c]
MTKAESIAEKYTEAFILPSDPLRPMWNMESIICGKTPRWNYVDNCMITAVLMMYDINENSRLLDYAIKFTDAYVEDDGSIPTMNYADYNLDNINGGKNLFRLWSITGEEKYRLGFEKLWNEQIIRQPRLPSGNFWHKAIYPNQVWPDGAYMALPFMAEYAKLHDLRGVIEDVQRQLTDIRKIMRDPVTGLYYHGYDDTNTMFWADRITGLSKEIWLRSNGWLCAALADVCEILTEKIPIRNQLNELLTALSGYCTDEGMLMQLPAYPSLKGNYPETSGTLLFAYSALKAYRLGICGENIRQSGLKAFEAVTNGYIDNSGDVPVMQNICLVGGLGGESGRDGSAEYYLSEKVIENDGKGVAPYLMTYTELMKKV